MTDRLTHELTAKQKCNVPTHSHTHAYTADMEPGGEETDISDMMGM